MAARCTGISSLLWGLRHTVLWVDIDAFEEHSASIFSINASVLRMWSGPTGFGQGVNSDPHTGGAGDAEYGTNNRGTGYGGHSPLLLWHLRIWPPSFLPTCLYNLTTALPVSPTLLKHWCHNKENHNMNKAQMCGNTIPYSLLATSKIFSAEGSTQTMHRKLTGPTDAGNS